MERNKRFIFFISFFQNCPVILLTASIQLLVNFRRFAVYGRKTTIEGEKYGQEGLGAILPMILEALFFKPVSRVSITSFRVARRWRPVLLLWAAFYNFRLKP